MCVVRVCKTCEAPSIWIAAQSEIPDPENSPPKRPAEPHVYPRRNRARVKARVLACIRRRGFQEEVAAFGDLSKGGMRFVERHQDPPGRRVELGPVRTPRAGRLCGPRPLAFF